jgi:phosphoenolpyruvate carboxylase
MVGREPCHAAAAGSTVLSSRHGRHASENGETPEKDFPLRYDTRLLGRILGDTVRSQEGDRVFELVERIRRTGVQFHRNADEGARRELQEIMSGLPTDTAIKIIRAFGYFSHLANLAEDQHHIRRTRAHEIAGRAAASAARWPMRSTASPPPASPPVSSTPSSLPRSAYRC